MHRLSGAGVVARTLAAPTTERALFGRVGPDDFSVAFVPGKRDITPFHPIIRGSVSPTADGGCTVHAELAHHPNARTFAPLFILGAIALATGTVLGARQDPVMFVSGLSMATLFAIFPKMHARIRFQQAVERTTSTFEDLLDIKAIR
jgi:hypothetical protein